MSSQARPRPEVDLRLIYRKEIDRGPPEGWREKRSGGGEGRFLAGFDGPSTV